MSDVERRAERIFNDALELSPAERDEYLRDACGTDTALRTRVDALLASYRGAPRFLEEAAAKVPGMTDATGSGGPDDRDPLGRFGPYELLQELGRGGQGSVYLARDGNLGRNVALKILSLPLALDPASLERFRREGEAASRLEHPAICTIYEAGEVGGVPYLAMRYLQGETLESRIAAAAGDPSAPVVREGPAAEPSSGRAVRDRLAPLLVVFEQIARALHCAHEAGLVHRDIKPGNIMITPSEDPVILDFGLARDVEGNTPTITRTGDTLGTPHYMSPEQISSTEPVDRTTDIYSLGVTLFESLTLHRPFEAPTREALYQKVLGSVVSGVRRRRPGLPRDIEIVVATAMERDRLRRYQTALDLAEDLRRVREHEPILACPAGPALRVRRWSQRNPVVATALLGVFLLLALGLGLALYFIGRLERSLRHTQALALASEAAKLSEKDSLRALLLAREAVERKETLETVSQLYQAVGELHERAVFEGHESPVVFVDESPSGDLIVTSSEDGTARLWRPDGQPVHVLRASDASETRVPCYMARFSPAGDRVLTASQDGTARIWDLRGREVHRFIHESGVKCAVFSPRGDLVVTGTWGGTVTVWRVGGESATGEPLHRERAHSGGVLWIAMSPGGERFVSVSGDSTGKLWSLEGRSVREITSLPHEGRVVRAQFAPTGDHFVTVSGADPWGVVSRDYAASLWDSSGRLRAHIEQEHASDARFSRDGSRIVTTSHRGEVRIWGLDGEEQLVLAGRGQRRIFGASFSPDDRWILTYGFGPPVVYDRSGFVVAELRGHGSQCTWARFTKGGDILTVSHDRTARLWTLRWRDGYPVLRPGGVVWSAVSPDGREILCTGNGASLWDFMGREIQTIVAPGQMCDSGAFSSEGDRILVSKREGPRAELFERDGRFVSVFPVHDDRGIWPLYSATFLPGGGVLTASTSLRIWDQEGNLFARVPAPDESAQDPRFFSARSNRSGSRFLTAGNHRSLEVDGGRDGNRYGAAVWSRELDILEFLKHDNHVTYAEFDADERRVLTACMDRKARLWTLGSTLPPVEFVGHEGDVWCATFSPDGQRVVTASEDHTARIWDLEGNCHAILRGHRGGVISSFFTPEGDRIVTGSDDGTVRVWPARLEDLLRLAQDRAYRGITPADRAEYPELLRH